MKSINEIYNRDSKKPIKIMQFGEGNFLRSFFDYMIDIANEKGVFSGDVAIVKPISFGSLENFREQDNLYTVLLRGKENGETVDKSRVIKSVAMAIDAKDDYEEWISLAHSSDLRFIVSNTTEAGIVLDENDTIDGLPATYPGKLTKWLFERYTYFGGKADKGVIILPVELIEDNGKKLKHCVLSLCKAWKTSANFAKWIEENCIFCSTLVDRIVTGFPKKDAEEICEKLGYTDKLLSVAEPFALWVIESEKDIRNELPLDKAGLPVIFTDNQKPYRERKVRVLNGAHTSSVLAAFLAGESIVRDMMQDEVLGSFTRRVAEEEIAPCVPLPQDEVKAFADSVFERFENPFIDHELLSISLNSVSKWKARVLPTFRDYTEKFGKLPPLVTFSLAALLAFYSSTDLQADGLHAKCGDRKYVVNDDRTVLEFFANNCEKSDFVTLALSNENFWGEDLTKYKGLADAVRTHLASIKRDAKTAIRGVL